MGDNEITKRWTILLIVSLAEMLAISAWLVYSAISKEIDALWGLSSWQSGAMTTSVQIGFVVGTLLSATLNLADIWPNKIFFAVCAVLAAFANSSLIFCDGFWTAVATRFLVGLFMAGVYPPAMKMIATWFKTNRGFAIGTLIGALTLGKAIPFLLKVLQISQWETNLICSSVAGLVGAALVGFLYRDGPHPFQRKPFSIALISEVIRHRPTRLAIGGYLGHMWELYAMWTWVGAFIVYAAEANGVDNESVIVAVTFAIISVGSIGCILGGWLADKFGREKFVNLAMFISGLCCVSIGFCIGLGFWVCVAIALLWGFFVVADSAQFSTMVTEVSPQHAVGTALTLQTCIGFLLTTVTIQLTPQLSRLIGWEYAFAILAIGPLFGIMSIRKFAHAKSE